jgi:3-oxoacyl-[acyl-carrier protein] reductase
MEKSMIDTGLRDRVALVTGANHGIGAATASALAAQGARVFIHYWRLAQTDEEGAWRRMQDAAAVLEEIRAHGGRAEATERDLADPTAVAELFVQVEAALGPVDVLVNNAAVGGEPKDTFVPLQQESVDSFERSLYTITAASHDRHFAVNSRATALMMAEFARRHVTREATWGRIINISTDGAYCFPNEISYGASKAALEAYSRSAAIEFAQYGITVNIVSPGPIQTGWIRQDMEAGIAEGIPLGRLGQPQDVADVIVFLASEQARWLTGQCLHVGGGHRM